MRWKVYVIRDSQGVVRYVGKSNNAERCIWTRHKNAKTPLGGWIRSELAAGRSVELSIEAAFTEQDCDGPDFAARGVEHELIQKFAKENGELLFNVRLRG